MTLFRARCLIYATSISKLIPAATLLVLSLFTPVGWHRLVFRAGGWWWYAISWLAMLLGSWLFLQTLVAHQPNPVWFLLHVPHFALWTTDSLGLWDLVHSHTLRRHGWRLQDHPAAIEG